MRRKLRTRIIAAATGLIFMLAPALARAELGRLPDWKMQRIGNDDYGCYDFDSARKLKLFETDALLLDAEVVFLRRKVELLDVAVVKLTSSYDLLSRSQESLQYVNGQLTTQRDAAYLRAARAESQSLLGGGLVWVLVALVTGIAAGTVVGVYISK